MRELPTGKCYFVWMLSRCAGGDPLRLAAMAQEAGLSWLIFKVMDEDRPYQPERIHAAIAAARGAGLGVWGYQYTYGYKAKQEGIAGAKIAQDLGLDGFVIDAEVEYQIKDGARRADIYCTGLKTGLQDAMPIALSSFRYPSSHLPFPWRSFLRISDLHMPQVYWEEAHNPSAQLERSVRELRALKDIPILPTGATYATSKWAPSVAELDGFDAKAKALGLQAVSWWSWQHAEAVPAWWNAIAAHRWGPPPEPGPLFVDLAWEDAQDELARWGVRIGALTADGRVRS